MRARTCTTNKNFVHCEILEHFFFLGSGWGPGLGSRAGAGLGLGLGWLGPGLGLASSTNFSTGGRARAINFDHKAFFCLLLLLCSKRSGCALFLCFSGAPKTQRCLYVCAFFVLSLCCFLCSRRCDCAPFLCFSGSGAPKTKRVCMAVLVFVLSLCSKRSGRFAFLLLETIRLRSCFVPFWCSQNQTCLYGCAFFVLHDFKTPWIKAFLVLETIRLCVFSCAFLALILLGLFLGPGQSPSLRW